MSHCNCSGLPLSLKTDMVGVALQMCVGPGLVALGAGWGAAT